MLFSSLSFLLIFLPIVCLVYYFAKPQLKNAVLLIASLIFYAIGEPSFLIVALSIIIINYLGVLLITSANTKFDRKGLLILTVALNLSVLIYFKYFNFLVFNINKLFSGNLGFLDVVLPLGISFYTFQALSYVLDVYKGEVEPQKDLYKLTLYIMLFPQLIAGPIIKYHDIKKQIDSREHSCEKFVLGLKRFIGGLGKKVLIANMMGLVADKIFVLDVQSISFLTSWIGAIAYSLQIYYDFSAYSDMAIGLGLMFGFKFRENFNYPYVSKSVNEFWKRWHISLSSWFKEYLYIPLGGNRLGILRTSINLLIVFLLTGLWHGAAWNFIFWGLWFAAFLILEKTLKFTQFKGVLASVSLHMYTLLVCIISWVLFRSESLSYAYNYILTMFNPLKEGYEMFSTIYYVKGQEFVFLIAIICAMPIFKNIIYSKNKFIAAGVNLYLVIIFLLSITFLVGGSYNPFIYFRF